MHYLDTRFKPELISSWTDTGSVVSLPNEVLLGHEKGTKRNAWCHIDGSRKHYAEENQSAAKDYTLNNFIDIKCLEWEHRERERRR